MKDLGSFLINEIKNNGPMPLSSYIQQCLLHPTFGYYSKKPVFGVDGDFTTAPEISQMFGELIALSILQTWIDQGSPSQIILTELGPGRGTMMADMFRTFKLPIEQYLRKGENFFKRTVQVSDGKLEFGLEEKPTKNYFLDMRLSDTSNGDIVELNLSAAKLSKNIGEHINNFGGAAIFIDYGDWRSLGDTLQAVKNHEYCNVFVSPGELDISAHVDFEILALNSGCAFSKLTTQGVLLERLGITERANNLAKSLKGKALESHISAHRRLTHPKEMGSIFKALSLFPKNSPCPPGFEQ